MGSSSYMADLVTYYGITIDALTTSSSTALLGGAAAEPTYSTWLSVPRAWRLH